MKKLLAWSAHAYTAVGLVCAAAMAVLIVRGGDEAFRATFVLMVAATLVDGTDGWWARRVEVETATPGFDGRRLDDLIDFLTYTCLPILLVWRAGLLHPLPGWWLVVPLVASAYGFCQVQAKTEDHYFLGFPSFWNVIALYLHLLRLPPGWALALVLVFSLLTFVPARYLYPSLGNKQSAFTVAFGAAWVVALLAVLYLWQRAPRWLVVASLAFPAYYMAASWLVTVRLWSAGSGRPVSR